VREAVIERSGGNPLFALELVRMLQEAPGGAATVPTSVRAVIGAWLDAIPREQRAVLQDAAVGGTAFWPGALVPLADGEGAEQAWASGETDVEEAARESAVRWLGAAGDLAARVDEAGAFALYDRARALAAERSEALAYTLARTGVLGRYAGMLPGIESLSRLQASLVLERIGGDPRRIGDALVRLGVHLGALGEAAGAQAAYDEAVSLLEPLPPGVELAKAFAFRAEEEMFAGHLEDSLAWAERGLELGRALDSPEVMIVALHIRGDGRCSAGDIG